MENQMDKEMESEVEAGLTQGRTWRVRGTKYADV